MKIGVVGAGPAGLSAAYELTAKGQEVTVFEHDPQFVGGISRTVTYHGYRFDIGGHRFFSKNPEVEDFWSQILGDDLMTRSRMSRILYNGKFYDYPLKPLNAFRNMGVLNTLLCVIDAKAQFAPPSDLRTFEDWVVRHFGRRLYTMFFKTYTEKVWGTPCNAISADWDAQRIKGLSLASAIKNAFRLQGHDDASAVIKTLVDEFRYPRLGPGMLWDQVVHEMMTMGGVLEMGSKVMGMLHHEGRARTIAFRHADGVMASYDVDHVVSSMPLRSLIRAMSPKPPGRVIRAAEALQYRDSLRWR
ncbi:NAD(P)-binding protein [Sulfobacillus harzensis]|uniref:NAD(P)-binding protein n=1 Tax=Sulfobacillus harzensis TaxID=2729629 RepID=UPI001A9A8585|nr:NAD(P)-binding protein [Sulfobacillus harzensis]